MHRERERGACMCEREGERCGGGSEVCVYVRERGVCERERDFVCVRQRETLRGLGGGGRRKREKIKP